MVHAQTPSIVPQKVVEGGVTELDSPSSAANAELPSALREAGSSSRSAAQQGPVRLRQDERGQIPGQPSSLDDLWRRFYPVMSRVRVPEVHTLTSDAPRMDFEFRPEAGVCYVMIAWNTALGDFEERQRQANGQLRWWESGADIDAQVRLLETDAFIAEDLTREAYPRVRWCSDGRPVRILVRIAIVHESPPEVQFAWTVLRDDVTTEALRYEGDSPLARRLRWAQAMVAPRSRPITAPLVHRFAHPGLVTFNVDRPKSGCDLIVAIGEPTVESLNLSVAGDRLNKGDFRGEWLSALPLCADEYSEQVGRFVLAVRDGHGAVALARYRLR